MFLNDEIKGPILLLDISFFYYIILFFHTVMRRLEEVNEKGKKVYLQR